METIKKLDKAVISASDGDLSKPRLLRAMKGAAIRCGKRALPYGRRSGKKKGAPTFQPRGKCRKNMVPADMIPNAAAVVRARA